MDGVVSSSKKKNHGQELFELFESPSRIYAETTFVLLWEERLFEKDPLHDLETDAVGKAPPPLRAAGATCGPLIFASCVSKRPLKVWESFQSDKGYDP